MEWILKKLKADITNLTNQRDEKIAEVNSLIGAIEYAQRMHDAISVPQPEPAITVPQPPVPVVD